MNFKKIKREKCLNKWQNVNFYFNKLNKIDKKQKIINMIQFITNNSAWIQLSNLHEYILNQMDTSSNATSNCRVTL